MGEPLLRDLMDLPEQVTASDYVVSLKDGVTDPDRTVDTYVVTEQLVECFDRAMGLITSAVEERDDKGAYLHGSFGAGKSHFMAMLHLLVEGNQRARNLPELAPVVDRYADRLDGRSTLLVPYQMIGKESMEQAIFDGYVAHIRSLHPEAPLPAVYASAGLLEDAKRLRGQIGDEAFFGMLGSVEDADFGALAAGWDADSFDRALAQAPGAEERDRLVSDLIDHVFTHAIENRAATASGYVPFDQGLNAISRHAAGLGYDGIILFLDELILWFATRMADPKFVNEEAPKVSQLVEAASRDRPAPMVSFIARQRDLRDFVGEGVPGVEQLQVAHALDYFQGRFDVIELADKNLIEIAEKRLLKANSEAARTQIDQAFEQLAARAGGALDTLITSDGDRDEFRRLYPFNPALVKTLVAVSSYLQRERTALRLLGLLLSRRRDTLHLGDLVPLGDLYDVIAGEEETYGVESFSADLKRYFDRARSLYRVKLRPLLLREHGLTDEQAEEVDDDHPFRTDDRLVKTLLLAALAPETEPLRELTVRRLADLNHGTIKSPIPGQERAAVLGRVTRWSAQAGEIRVEGDEQDPRVAAHITGVDIQSVLDHAREADTAGARRMKLRELLAADFGVEESERLGPSSRMLVWRGSKRTVDVRFANIRNAADIPVSEFRAEPDRPRVVISYPFDEEPDRTAAEDHARLADEVHDAVAPTATLCWIPRFLSAQALHDLGRLVVMEHVLATEQRFEHATRHLSPQDRTEARQLIDNQARTLRRQLHEVLRQAYGLDKANPMMVVGEDSLAEQFRALDPSLQVNPPIAANLGEAFDAVCGQLLAHLYPRHPDFGEEEVRRVELATCLAYVEQAVQEQNQRVDVARQDRKAIRKILGPLKLADVGEAHLVLRPDWVDHLERQRAGEPAVPVTVRRVRAWIDQPTPAGLDTRVANLVICAYALQTDRVLRLHGQRVEPTVDRLDADTELAQLDLPGEDDYERARRLAERLFGLTTRPVCNATSVAELAAHVREAADQRRAAARELVQTLERDQQQLGLDADSDRLRTARAARDLLDAIRTDHDRAVVEALARAEIPTTAQALDRSVATAGEITQALNTANWDLLRQVQDLPEPWASQGAGIHQRLAKAARTDELTDSLPKALRQAAHEATDLLGRAAREQQPRPKPPQPKTAGEGLPATDHRTETGDKARELAEQLAHEAEERDLEELDVRWKFRQ